MQEAINALAWKDVKEESKLAAAAALYADGLRKAGGHPLAKDGGLPAPAAPQSGEVNISPETYAMMTCLTCAAASALLPLVSGKQPILPEAGVRQAATAAAAAALQSVQSGLGSRAVAMAAADAAVTVANVVRRAQAAAAAAAAASSGAGSSRAARRQAGPSPAAQQGLQQAGARPPGVASTVPRSSSARVRTAIPRERITAAVKATSEQAMRPREIPVRKVHQQWDTPASKRGFDREQFDRLTQAACAAPSDTPAAAGGDATHVVAIPDTNVAGGQHGRYMLRYLGEQKGRPVVDMVLAVRVAAESRGRCDYTQQQLQSHMSSRPRRSPSPDRAARRSRSRSPDEGRRGSKRHLPDRRRHDSSRSPSPARGRRSSSRSPSPAQGRRSSSRSPSPAQGQRSSSRTPSPARGRRSSCRSPDRQGSRDNDRYAKDLRAWDRERVKLKVQAGEAEQGYMLLQDLCNRGMLRLETPEAYRAALEFLKQLPAWCGDDEVLLCAYLEGKMLQKADAEGSRTAASTIILLITSDRNLRTFKVLSQQVVAVSFALIQEYLWRHTNADSMAKFLLQVANAARAGTLEQMLTALPRRR